MSASDLLAACDIETTGNSKVIPLNQHRPKAAYQPFPLECLPPAAKNFVADVCSVRQIDPAMVALPALATMAAAIGCSSRIEIKKDWREFPILWLALVVRSGGGKTPALDAATEPVKECEATARARYLEEKEIYDREFIDFDVALSQYKKGKLNEQPMPPTKPIQDRFYSTNSTVEALAPLLNENPRGLLFLADELTSWLSFGAYNGQSAADRAGWLSLHSATGGNVDRKSGVIYLPRAGVSLIGGVQPGVLAKAMDFSNRESGLLARLLLAAPPQAPKKFSEKDINEKLQGDYTQMITTLYELPTDINVYGELEPTNYPLTKKAKTLFADFANSHAVLTNQQTKDHYAAFFSKIEAYAARLSLVIHLASGKREAVEADTVGKGIKLAQWFLNEGLRLYDQFVEQDEGKELRQLVEKIQSYGGAVKPSKWWNNHKSRLSDVAAAENELELLVGANLASWRTEPATAQGGRPSKTLILNNP